MTAPHMRQQVLLEEPFCVGFPVWPASPHGIERVSTTHVIHITPVNQGGTDARENFQALCRSCAATKAKFDNKDAWRRR